MKEEKEEYCRTKEEGKKKTRRRGVGDGEKI